MSLPNPPYTYNDPRLLYNEVCFFYDGGYDSVCLAGALKIIGGSVPGRREPKKPAKPFFNIFIEYKLIEVNGKKHKPRTKSKWFRYAGENDAIEISINGVNIDITKPMVEGKFVDIVKQIISYSGSLESKVETFNNLLMSSSYYITTKENKAPKVILDKEDHHKHDDYQIKCDGYEIITVSNNKKEE